MDILKNIREKASSLNKHIVLPEGNDLRMQLAAHNLSETGLCRVTLLGEEKEIREQASANQISLDQVEIIEPGRSNMLDFLS